MDNLPSQEAIEYTMTNYQNSKKAKREYEKKKDTDNAVLATEDMKYWEVGLIASGAMSVNGAAGIWHYTSDPDHYLYQRQRQAEQAFILLTSMGLPNFEPVGNSPFSSCEE